MTVSIDGYISERQYSDIKRGHVKHYAHKSIVGYGYLGYGKFNRGNSKRAYTTWKHMIERCYSETERYKYPTYIDVDVCDEWLNFQNFAKWHKRYYPTNGLEYEIDKDLLSGNDKIYSPQTCIFIQRKLNAYMANEQGSGKCPGVHKRRYYNKWKVIIGFNNARYSIGDYGSEEEAILVYKKERAKASKKLRAYYSFDYPKYILDNII